ncbi:universal stress protein [Salinactinospora qingdaonensis]|uniref:UspA domain-containing protein n=1 Tax=Salinactinospora qingdaonensis TaxID=702744 RepID=A0ABP7GJ05_9ACTN
MENETSQQRHVVVGFNGSVAAVAALAWAAREARLRECELWAIRVIDGGHNMRAPYAGADPSEAERRAEDARELRRAVADVQQVWERTLPLVAEDDLPARALLTAAENADLLVLGTPEHDSLMVPTLGSTAIACVRAAPCPVVIVTGTSRGAFASSAELAGATKEWS